VIVEQNNKTGAGMGQYGAMKESFESMYNRISEQNYPEVKLQVHLCLKERSFDFWSFCAVYVQRRSLFFLRIPLLDTTCFCPYSAVCTGCYG
jgi:hypothetical protein